MTGARQPGNARLSPSVTTNPLLRMGRINAVVMPVFATVICILLFAYHLKDPTQDGQLLDGMETAAETMDHTQKLRVLEASGVLQELPTQRAEGKHLSRVRRVLDRLRVKSGVSSTRPQMQGRLGGHVAQHSAVQKVQGLLELQQLSLSDEIDIEVPSSGKRGTVQHVWTDEGWVEKRVAPTWLATNGHNAGSSSAHTTAIKAKPFTLSSAQQAWDNWVNTALLGEKLVATVTTSTSSSANTGGAGGKTTAVGPAKPPSAAKSAHPNAHPKALSAGVVLDDTHAALVSDDTHAAVTATKSTSDGKRALVAASAASSSTGAGKGSISTSRRRSSSSSKQGRMAKLALDSSSEGVGEGGSVGESMAAPMSVGSFGGRYSDDVPGGASGGESGPFRDNPEGQPGGWYHYVDDEGNAKYYSEHVVGMRKGQYSVLNPRTPLLDQGAHEDGDLTGGTVEESDRGLLSDQRDHKVRYKGEDGQIHYYKPYGFVTSVHKGKRLLCLKNCDKKVGERNTPVGDSYQPGPDVWPNLALPLKQQKEEDKVEAQEGDDDEDEQPNSAVEKETQDIHLALSELRQRTREQADVGGEDSLAALDKSHEQLQASLKLAKKVTKDAEYQAYLEWSIHDLARQLNASEIALDYAQKDDFSYIGKLVPGQQEGELGSMYQQMDPLLLNSIRRGDFVKDASNDTVPYEDSAGNPINDDEMQKLTDQSGKDIKAIGKQAKELFDALPLVDSHMMGDDKIHHANKGAPDAHGYLDSPVYRPLKRLDRLCLMCESLSGSGELSSVPACAGMSCGTGAWRESDASTLYDERTLNVALHPPTDSLKKKSVLERSRFPEADPEPNEGLGTYGTTQSAQRAAVPMHSMFKGASTQLETAGAQTVSLASADLHASALLEASLLKSVKTAHASLKTVRARPRTTSLKAVAPRGGVGGTAALSANNVGGALARVGDVARSKLGRAVSEGETRAFACEYLATTTEEEHKPILERLFMHKYHEPLRCTGRERRLLHTAGKGAVRAGGGDFKGATHAHTLAKKSVQQTLATAAPGQMGEVPARSVADGEPKEGDEEVGVEKTQGALAQTEVMGDSEGGAAAVEAGPEESVYLYVGRDAQPAFQYKMEDILSKQLLHGDAVQIKTFRSISKEAMRAVLWSQDCGVVMFPPFYSVPDFKPEAKRDIRNYVRGGDAFKGTVMFVGGGLEIGVINRLFDFSIHPEYVAGPYYKNERYVTDDSSFKGLPDLVPEVGNVYGMALSTLPPNSRSFYDSFGVSVAACVRYDLGRVCFLAQDFLDVLKDEVGPWAELVQAMINYK